IKNNRASNESSTIFSSVQKSGLIVRMRATALPHPDERQTERAEDDRSHPDIDYQVHVQSSHTSLRSMSESPITPQASVAMASNMCFLTTRWSIGTTFSPAFARIRHALSRSSATKRQTVGGETPISTAIVFCPISLI